MQKPALIHKHSLFHCRTLVDDHGRKTHQVALNEREVSHSVADRIKLSYVPFDFHLLFTGRPRGAAPDSPIESSYVTMELKTSARLMGQSLLLPVPVYHSGLLLFLRTQCPQTLEGLQGVQEPTEYFDLCMPASTVFETLWLVYQKLLWQTNDAGPGDEAFLMQPPRDILQDADTQFEATVKILNNLESRIIYMCRFDPAVRNLLLTPCEEPRPEDVDKRVWEACCRDCMTIATFALQQRIEFWERFEEADPARCLKLKQCQLQMFRDVYSIEPGQDTPLVEIKPPPKLMAPRDGPPPFCPLSGDDDLDATEQRTRLAYATSDQLDGVDPAAEEAKNQVVPFFPGLNLDVEDTGDDATTPEKQNWEMDFHCGAILPLMLPNQFMVSIYQPDHPLNQEQGKIVDTPMSAYSRLLTQVGKLDRYEYQLYESKQQVVEIN